MVSKGFVKIANILSVLIFSFFLIFVITKIYASDVSVSATVGNGAPNIGSVQVCSTTCANQKTIAPATAFHLKVQVSDPNGMDDVNRLVLYIFNSSLTVSSPDGWDHITLDNIDTVTSGDGCTEDEANGIFCFPVSANDWTTKFKSGNANVVAIAYDRSNASFEYGLPNGIIVDQLVSMTLDSTSLSYSGSPDTNDNAALSNLGNNYVLVTNSGNVDVNVNVAHTALVSGENIIPAHNVHEPTRSFFFPDDNSFSTMGTLSRGSDPLSSDIVLETQLDIPANTPTGTYTGTFSINVS